MFHRFTGRLKALLGRHQLDAEMAEEMRLHMELQTELNLEAGMNPEEARYAAQRKFGNVASIQEQAREVRGWVWLEQVSQDLRYAVRSLARQRGFATVSILTLALGIGATTAIFSVVNSIILKPLPYEQPGQLVEAFEVPGPGAQVAVSPGVFMDWRAQGTQFEGFAAFDDATVNLSGAGEPERITGLRISANGLTLLRARPVLGRIFAPDEDQAGKDKVIVLTYELWQNRFGGATDVIGRNIALNGEAFTVIGVLPAGFLPLDRPQFAIPLVCGPGWADNRGGHFLRVYARLRPGVTIEQARSELAAIAQRSQSLYPSFKKDWTASLARMDEQLTRAIKPMLLVLLGAVGFLLLIACANVANLLLARASSREKEITLRAALGASRARIVRQMLAESLLLSLVSGLLGVALAFGATGALRGLTTALNFARAHVIAVDATVLGAALGIALLTGAIVGLVPALRASRPDLSLALKDAARGSAASGNRLRSGLIVGEVGLSLVLLVGAGLLLHSFLRLVNVSPGFDPENALTMQLSLADAKYPDNSKRAAHFSRVAERVAALPGVSAAGLIGVLQLGHNRPQTLFRIPGWAGDRDPGFDADYDFCTADFFRAMAIPLRRGRFFEPRDLAADRRVAIINEAMARACFPDEDPVGRQLVVPGQQTWEIVGVVGDIRSRGLSQPVRPMVYRPQATSDVWRDATLVVRTAGAPLGMAEAVRKAILDLDSTQPVANVQTLADVVAGSLADRRLTFFLFALFALAALLLAGIGLYGVVAFAVGQRTREFGIRVALGAATGDVLGLVMRRGLMLAGIGLGCGIAGALGLTHLLGTLLYEIKPTDPLTFAAVSLLLLVVALLASWLPARRAARVDPIVALRAE